MASPNIKFEFVPTPNPSEMAIRVWQDANQLSLNSVPTLGTIYTASNLPVEPKLREFAKIGRAHV